MTAISKNVYINKVNDIVNEYKHTYHRTIKMKPVDFKDNTYIDSMELHSGKEVHDKDPKFKIGDHVRISKYKNIFTEGYKCQIGLKKFLLLIKLKIQIHGHI